MKERFQKCRVHLSKRLVDGMMALQNGGVEIALVVDDNERLVGTLTDGDVRRALLSGATLDAPLEPFVHKQFVSVSPAAGRAEVMDLMRARWVNQIPIVDATGRLVGLHLLHEMIGVFERPNWAVLMAGGKGMRLRPITENLPKPMIPVAGRPILERIVLHLVGFGVRRLFLAVNYMAEVIERHFGDGSRFGCRIEYLRERKPLGTGGALSLLPELPDHPLLVLNGDLLTEVDVGRLLDFHERGGYVATVGVHEYAHTVPFGVLEVEGNRVRDLREKPTIVWHTNTGIYALSPHIISRVPKDTEFPLPALIEECIQKGEPIGAYQIEGDWIDVGRQRELARARGELDKP